MFRTTQFLAQFHVLGDELLQMDIAVADAPPLIDDDGHQDKNHHHKGDSQGYGDYKSPFVTPCELWIEFGCKNTKRQRNGCLTGGKICLKTGKLQKSPISSGDYFTPLPLVFYERCHLSLCAVCLNSLHVMP